MLVLLFLFIFVFGTVIGSFICASIYRVYHHKSILLGRSACANCKNPLKFYDLIPILSFIILGRKCRICKSKIAWEYFLIEFITGILFTFVFFWSFFQYFLPDAFAFLIIRDWIFVGGAIFLFVYDLKYKILPDKVMVPIILLIFGINVYLGFNIYNLLFAATIGGWWFALQYLISRGKWVGDGDIRMGVLLGVLLGFSNILFALFLAYILGAFVGLYLILTNKKEFKSEIAFGTFLTIGGFVALYCGEFVIDWYKTLIGL